MVPLYLAPICSPRSQLLDRRLWAGGFFVAIIGETAYGQGVCATLVTLPIEYQMYYDL